MAAPRAPVCPSERDGPLPVGPLAGAVAGSPVSLEVLVASALLVLAAAPVLVVLPHDRLSFDAALPIVGWLPVGIAGVLALDRRPRSLVGRAAVVGSLTPLVLLVVAAARTGGENDADALHDAVRSLGLLTVAPLIGLALVVGAAGARRPPAGDRATRRWSCWVAVASTSVAVAAGLARVVAVESAFSAVATAGLGLVACVIVASAHGACPRPLDEPLLDAGLVGGVLVSTALVGGTVRLVAAREQVFGADVVGAFAAAATVAFAALSARWVRREALRRRYGPDALAAAGLASLTGAAGGSDPRALLGTAAAVVSTSSGVRSARVLLDDVEPAPGWRALPLAIGREPVGTLLVEPVDPEGLERRQERTILQLLPAISLVARAVTSAVDAEHARLDVLHERDAERARILADLHDDLGPVLAGMSMRVAAALALQPSPELAELADDLATCRADLRRIVAGLVPAAVQGGELGDALARLVASFRTLDGPTVVLSGDVPSHLAATHSAVLYRSAAEGITNAVRHAGAATIVVSVERDDGLRLTVVDDGEGEPGAVAGVGLTSLSARAAELGGRLTVTAAAPHGTRLCVVLPEAP